MSAPPTRHRIRQLDVKALAHAVVVNAVEQDLARAQVLHGLAPGGGGIAGGESGGEPLEAFSVYTGARHAAAGRLGSSSRTAAAARAAAAASPPHATHLGQLHSVHVAPLAATLDRALPPAVLLALGPFTRRGKAVQHAQ